MAGDDDNQVVSNADENVMEVENLPGDDESETTEENRPKGEASNSTGSPTTVGQKGEADCDESSYECFKKGCKAKQKSQ